MRVSILVIEDERDMAELIRMYLEREGMDVTIRESAEDGLAALEEGDFDCLILDINLPGMDGYELLQSLRTTSSVPVIIVSARESDEDIIMGLGIGADEFVTKPFAPKVLVARVRALLRRISAGKAAGTSKSIQFNGFSLDVDGYLLRKQGRRIPLSVKEFEVLTYLASHAGRALAPDTIYRDIWGNEYGDLTTIAVYVQRIRKKIEEDPKNPVFLQTIHGKGYRFNPETISPAAESSL